MIGFHIEDYCLNFLDCCQRGLGARVDRLDILIVHGTPHDFFQMYFLKVYPKALLHNTHETEIQITVYLLELGPILSTFTVVNLWTTRENYLVKEQKKCLT
jgi:hypothetical protein